MADDDRLPRNSHMQVQMIALAIFVLLGLLLVTYRSEIAARDLRQVSYDACQARTVQAEEVNRTRANIGQLIIAMVPNAPAKARAAMLAGMSTTQLVHEVNCEAFRP